LVGSDIERHLQRIEQGARETGGSESHEPGPTAGEPMQQLLNLKPGAVWAAVTVGKPESQGAAAAA
jgi:hypothetical protein